MRERDRESERETERERERERSKPNQRNQVVTALSFSEITRVCRSRSVQICLLRASLKEEPCRSM